MGLSESVQFLGYVPRARLLSELYANSDALLFTSLQDSAGSVVLEAMAASLAVIGLDHQGAGMIMPEQGAIKVPVTSPRATVHALAAAIRKLATAPELTCQMGDAARRHAMTESWSRRVARMNELYRRCLELVQRRVRSIQLSLPGPTRQSSFFWMPGSGPGMTMMNPLYAPVH